jgi:membrane-associated phospholipid phosphatase
MFAMGCSLLRADVVTDWNEVFLRAVRNETTPPPLAARNLAILHTAIHDAINAVTRTHEPYCCKTIASTNTSLEAAATAAANQVAVALYPSRKADFSALFARSLEVPDTPMKTNGIALGRQVADAILAWRAKDGSSTTVPYIPSDQPGHWRRTPPLFRPPELPQWRFVMPFAMTNVTQFRPGGPPSLDSTNYAKQVNQVKMIGAKNSTNRTPEQTRIAEFWSDFSYTVTPAGHWNDITRSIVLNRKMSLEENARVFALLNITMADAAIVCWDAKYQYDFWRPVTAIREAEGDGNSETDAQGQWESLLATPPFPEYPSGHSTFSGAAAAVLATVFSSDKVSFSTGCDALAGVTRTYDSLWACAEEIGMSRIYGGIHFLSANRDGLSSGKALGEFVARTKLLPVK